VKKSHKLPALLIVCTALLSAGVFFVRGNSCGHDFDFHLLSWMEVARAWHAGLLYPHWVQNANYGAGEPRLIFYPPGSWLLGALLGSLVGWHAAPIVFVVLTLLAGGGSMYLLAREWLPVPAATFAACLYAANPYALFVAYERGAFGELLASAWLPLLVLFALRRRGSIAPLSMAVAALWISNSPAAVVGSYLLAVLAVGMVIAERKLWPAWRAAGGMSIGLGLAAFYIVPAAFEQRWVQIQRAIIPGMRVQDSFLFAHTGEPFHDQVLRTASWILVVEIILATVAAYLARKNQPSSKPRVVLTALLPIILLLQLPVSNAIWKLAPHMAFLQFPWRWSIALGTAGCALAGMAVVGETKQWLALVAGIVIAAMAISGGILFFQPCDEEDAVTPQMAAFQVGDGVEGTDEYTPVGVDNAAIQQHLPLVRVLHAEQDDTADSTPGDNPEWRPGDPGSIQAKVDARRPNGEHWLVSTTTPQPGFAVLRLMDYPAWYVTVDSKPVLHRPSREDGLMAVPLPAGNHQIEVRWQATSDVIAGRTLSAIALLALLGVAMRERRPLPDRRV
jgi:6-pyruvoyl-tetrahydropterin synthase related domain